MNWRMFIGITYYSVNMGRKESRTVRLKPPLCLLILLKLYESESLKLDRAIQVGGSMGFTHLDHGEAQAPFVLL